MTPLIFLDKNEQEKVTILQHIISSEETIFNSEVLANELDLSTYLIEKGIHEINEDCKINNLIQCSSIIGQYIYVQKNLSRDTLIYLLTYYFNNSASKIFFDTLLKAGKITFSNPEIAQKFSRANFFKLKKIFEENISFFVKHRATEYEWRSLLYSIYKFFNTMPDVETHNLNNIIDIIYSKYGENIPDTPSMRQQILSILTISYFRGQNGYVLAKNDFWLNSLPEIDQLSNVLNKYFFNEISNESRFIVQRFLEEGLLTEPILNQMLDVDDNSLWLNIYEATSFSFTRVFLDNSSTEYSNLLNKITNIIYIESNKFEFADDLHFSSSEYYFKSMYPFLHNNLHQLLSKLTNKVELSEHRINEIYFRIMSNILASNLTIKSSDHVLICVSFSGNINITRWIMKSIENLNYLNISLTQNLTNDVDIYISDNPIKDSSFSQIVWVKPPSPRDWFILGELITSIKQNKYLKESQEEQ